MSNQLIRNSKVLLLSNFEVTNTSANGGYQLSDWYHTQNAVPLEIVGAGNDPLSYNDNTLKIGGVGPFGNANSSSFLWSKNYFKYNPNKIYKLSMRVRCDAPISFGLVGYTSKPIPNLYAAPIANDAYRAEILNICRYMYSPDKYSVRNDGVLSSNAGPRTINHFPTNRNVGTTSYNEYVGYVSGHAVSNYNYSLAFNNVPNTITSTNYYDNDLPDGIQYDGEIKYVGYTFVEDPEFIPVGTGISTPLPLWEEILYVTPYMMVNFADSNNTKFTYIDYIKFEELESTYLDYTDAQILKHDLDVTSHAGV